MQLWSSSSFALPRAPTRAMARARSANEQLCNHLLDQKKVLPLPTWVTTEIANIAWTCGWTGQSKLAQWRSSEVFSSLIHLICKAQVMICKLWIPKPPRSIGRVQLSHAPLNSSHPLLLFFLYIKKSSDFINDLNHPFRHIHGNQKMYWDVWQNKPNHGSRQPCLLDS